MEGFIREVNSKEVSKVLSFYIGYRYIILKVNTRNRGLSLKTLFTQSASGAGDFMKSLSSFLTFLVMTCTLIP